MAAKLISVNLTPLRAGLLAALPQSADRQRVLRGVGTAALATWKALALEKLKSTARDYVSGLQSPDVGDGVVSITLEGRVPNMVEQGWVGGDMRLWMLTGKAVKYGANGPYVTVPFRHGTPGTGGRNVGTPMPPAIAQVAKRLAPTVTRPGAAVGGSGGSTTVWGQRLHPGMRMGAEAKAILATKMKPWHTASIYEGMIRKAQPTAKGLRTSGYHTFRRISLKSDPRAWQHPGIRARNLARATQQRMEKIAMELISMSQGGQR